MGQSSAISSDRNGGVVKGIVSGYDSDTGYIVCTSVPSGVAVYVNGEYVGKSTVTVPVAVDQMSVTRFDVEFSNPQMPQGQRKLVFGVDVAPGQNTFINARFDLGIGEYDYPAVIKEFEESGIATPTNVCYNEDCPDGSPAGVVVPIVAGMGAALLTQAASYFFGSE